MAFSAVTARVLSRSVREREGQTARPMAADADPDPDELLRAAYFHGIAGYVYEMIRAAPGRDDQLLRQLRGLRDRNSFTHLRSLLDLSYLEDTLTSRSIPWLIVKGPTLAAPVHGGAQLRGYSDLDALVPARDLPRSLDALTATGATLRDRNWTLIHEEMKGEVHVELPSGTELDLHWHLLNEPQRRSAFPIDVDQLFERSVVVDIDGAGVRTLHPVDHTIYIALHTIHSGAHRLIWLKDFERLLALDNVDPRQLAQRAGAWNASLVLRAALLRTEMALGPLPLAGPLRELLPPARVWEAAARRAWRAAPAAQEDGTGSIGRAMARSVRTTQVRSFANLTGRTYEHLRGGWRRGPDPEAPRHFAPDDPRSDRFPAGGEAARQAYLHAVTTQAPREAATR